MLLFTKKLTSFLVFYIDHLIYWKDTFLRHITHDSSLIGSPPTKIRPSYICNYSLLQAPLAPFYRQFWYPEALDLDNTKL